MSDLLKDYVNPNLQMARPDDPLMDIYVLMKRHKIRHVPVVESGRAVGIISDRDLQFVDATGDAFALKARDVMTHAPFSVDAMTSIPHAINIMVTRKINSILIHDQAQKIIGIFTSTDALAILYQTYKSKGEIAS